ncbi:ABC transporter ATP-binding protein [Micromonospora sp. NPDC049662]|uniref:ABC transporter ATP-binding protein n=1 Tax=Micromonospora sp. NPDC049662 TaxID=3155397 RepID=UPI0034410642
MSSGVRRLAGRVAERYRVWRQLAGLLPRSGWPVLIPGIAIAVARGLLPIVSILAMGEAIQTITGPSGSGEAAAAIRDAGAVLVLAFAAFALQQILSPFQAATDHLIARRVDGSLIRDLMSRAIRAPFERVEQQESISALTNATVNFLYIGLTPGPGAAAMLPLFSRYLELAAALTAIGVLISWPVAVLLGITALAIRYGRRGTLDRFSRLWNSLSDQRQRIFYLQTIGTDTPYANEMRALRLAPWLTERHWQDSEAHMKPLWSGRRSMYLPTFIRFSLLGYLVAALAFIAIATQTQGQTRVLGLAVAIQAVLVPLRFGSGFPEVDTATQYALHAQRELQDIERSLADVRAASSRRTLAPIAGPPTVRFADVTFEYPGGQEPVLRGLDLTLPAGRSTAIVGINGAGKTTLVKLLGALYNPTKGQILVENQDLHDLDPNSWRRHVAVILQDYVQYESTLRDNVVLGAPSQPVDEDALMDAIHRAGADDVLELLPNGLSTILSPSYDGGVGLSGGQWQRVALARALYAVNLGARLLVLDEPTAQLDVRSEAAFFDRFMELTSGLTTVVISHRFSTVRRADAIAVLADGGVAEYGRHDELMERNGTYAKMFRLQADRFVDEVQAGASLGDERAGQP